MFGRSIIRKSIFGKGANVNVNNISAGSSITINGVTIRGGNNVSIVNNEIFVDGKPYTGEYKEQKEITIVINGDTGNIDMSQGNVTVNGDVKGYLSNNQGDIHCGNVGGNITNNQGDITCGNVNGGVTTNMGDISYRKS